MSWQFFIISSPMLSKNKLSKKSFAANFKGGSFYPSRGHRSCIIPTDLQRTNVRSARSRARSSHDTEHEETTEDDGQKVSILTLGGSLHQSCKLWEESSRPVEQSFTIDEGDIIADENPSLPLLSGAELPGLANPGVACVWEENKIIIWGGDIVWTRGEGLMERNNHLFQMEHKPGQRGKLHFEVTKYAYPGTLAPSRQGRPATEQQGDIPEGRSGHSFTRLGEKKVALMFGGTTLKKRMKGMTVLPPSSECMDCSLYLLDLQEYKWKEVGPIHGLTPRCFHAASFTATRGQEGAVCFVGGMQFTGDKPSNRLPINVVDVVSIQDLSNNKFVHERIHIDMPIGDVKYLSSCATTVVNNKMYVFGGCSQIIPNIELDKFDDTSDTMYIIDLENQEMSVHHGCNPVLKTTGCSLLPIAEDVVLIAGGTSAQFSIFTTRSVESNLCAMEDDCKVNDDNHQEENLEWIFCDKCKKWYHLFCVGLRISPKGKYTCPHCV